MSKEIIHRTWVITSWVGFCLTLVACTSAAVVNGRLIVWHTWDEAEAPIIEEVLLDFQNLHPQIHLSVERIPYDTVRREFRTASEAGLGPDILLGLESVFVHELYEQGLVADLSEANVAWSQFSDATLQSIQRDNGVRVGVPLNAFVVVLFYHPALVNEPPTTLEELRAVSASGVKVGIPTVFFRSYWGITGTGGSLFDGNALSSDSVDHIAAWLDWLVDFQQTPGAVLSQDARALADGFVRQDVALLIADSLELAALTEQLENDQLGVALIPGSPQAKPFSNVELMMVNSASVQTEAAVLLSNFMSNPAQQRKLARTTSGRVPINQTVNLNPTLFPTVSIISQQNRTAVVPTTQQDDLINHLITASDPVYQQVLEGLITPTEGAQQIIDAVNRATEGQ